MATYKREDFAPVIEETLVCKDMKIQKITDMDKSTGGYIITKGTEKTRIMLQSMKRTIPETIEDAMTGQILSRCDRFWVGIHGVDAYRNMKFGVTYDVDDEGIAEFFDNIVKEYGRI